MKKNCSTRPLLEKERRRINFLYLASSESKIKRNCSTRPPPEQKWSRIDLPGHFSNKNEEILYIPDFLQIENDEEFLYPASFRAKTKNCPSRLPLKQTWWIALPGKLLYQASHSSKTEEELLYQTFPRTKMEKSFFTRPPPMQKPRRICSTRLPLKREWWGIALPNLLQNKNKQELLHQASKHLLERRWRIALPGSL